MLKVFDLSHPITFVIKLMSGKNFLFSKYSFIKKYAAERLSLRLIFRFLFPPRTLWKKDILAIISASKAHLMAP